MFYSSIEPITIISEHNNESRQAPDLAPRSTQAEVTYINQCCDLNLTSGEISRLLKKMAYNARPSETSSDLIDVDIPPTRADVLHQADIMEDVAISYGFNELPRSFPSKSGTIAQPLPVNKLTDIIRLEAAMAGWSEVLPLILCSNDENFAWLNRVDDGNTAIKLANPKTLEFQVVRTSLLPGLLKTIRENRKHSVPMKIFEVSDVAFKDLSLERKSRNERHFAAAWYGKTSGFEVVHGLLDRVMAMLKSAFITAEETLDNPAVGNSNYWIEKLNGETHSYIYCISVMLTYKRPNIFPRSCSLDTYPHRRKGAGHWHFRNSASYGVGEIRAQVPCQYCRDKHRSFLVSSEDSYRKRKGISLEPFLR